MQNLMDLHTLQSAYTEIFDSHASIDQIISWLIKTKIDLSDIGYTAQIMRENNEKANINLHTT